ncbi:hypothetical protein MKY29_11155 [Psychrobacillus sp. FSL K6-2365]|uniref:hypothetical protein n=1 Tax=Psychrobacillus sp. FSL K6-2365 TaxID=2921546 RepID=UPI0030F5BE20
MIKVYLLMLIVIILTGCNGIPVRGTFIQPEGKVILENNDYSMTIGDFEWKERDFEVSNISTSDKYELAGEFTTLEGSGDGKLEIEIDQNPTSIDANQWNTDFTSTTIEVKGNKITLPSEKGYYIYEVIVEWPQGKATYIFDIDIL